MKDKLKQNTSLYKKCIDHTVSKKSFELLKNSEYDLLITNPFPEDLSSYYESEDYISHTDKSDSLIDKLYQTVRNYTLKKKVKLINSFNTTNKKLLDIGCGTGDFLTVAQQNNWTVKGVEPSEKARTIALEKKVIIKEDLNKIIDEKFDVITLWHVLEHVENLEEYIKKIKELLSDNGTLIVAVPNFKSYDAQYYKNYWAAYDVPRHLWHFSKTSITKIFYSYDFSVEKILPMKFDSFYVSMLSEKYKTGKINYFKAFYIGLRSNWYGKTKKEYSSHIYILKKQNIKFKI